MDDGDDERPIPFSPGYRVRRDGVVLGLRGKPLAHAVSEWGYAHVTLYCGKKRVGLTVHRIVCMVFNGSPSDHRMVVRHKDDVPLNNHASNLEWGSNRDNHNDMVARGRAWFQKNPTVPSTRGDNHWSRRDPGKKAAASAKMRKLSTGDVCEIRRRVDRGERRVALAAEFGVSSSLVSTIASGKKRIHG